MGALFKSNGSESFNYVLVGDTWSTSFSKQWDKDRARTNME